jgi:hypothetical protein
MTAHDVDQEIISTGKRLILRTSKNIVSIVFNIINLSLDGTEVA